MTQKYNTRISRGGDDSDYEADVGEAARDARRREADDYRAMEAEDRAGYDAFIAQADARQRSVRAVSQLLASMGIQLTRDHFSEASLAVSSLSSLSAPDADTLRMMRILGEVNVVSALAGRCFSDDFSPRQFQDARNSLTAKTLAAFNSKVPRGTVDFGASQSNPSTRERVAALHAILGLVWSIAGAGGVASAADFFDLF